MDWENRLEIIKQKIKETLARQNQRDTDDTVAAFLEVSKPTYSKIKNNRKLPDAETFRVMASKLDLSADWLLLGIGKPERTQPEDGTVYDRFLMDTLLALLTNMNVSDDDIAAAGGISRAQLERIVNNRDTPQIDTLRGWIHAFRFNANFLIAQIGQPFLTPDQYEESGPLDRVREYMDARYTEQEQALSDAVEEKEKWEQAYHVAVNNAESSLERIQELKKLIVAQEESLLLYRRLYGPLDGKSGAAETDALGTANAALSSPPEVK